MSCLEHVQRSYKWGKKIYRTIRNKHATKFYGRVFLSTQQRMWNVRILLFCEDDADDFAHARTSNNLIEGILPSWLCDDWITFHTPNRSTDAIVKLSCHWNDWLRCAKVLDVHSLTALKCYTIAVYRVVAQQNWFFLAKQFIFQLIVFRIPCAKCEMFEPCQSLRSCEVNTRNSQFGNIMKLPWIATLNAAQWP